MNTIYRKKIHLYALALLGFLAGCAKFVEIDPPINALTDATAYKSDVTATAVMTGIFWEMATNTGFSTGGPWSLGGLAGLLTDELQTTATTLTYQEFYTNSISPDNGSLGTIWNQCYNGIYRANAVLEGVTASTSLTPAVQDQLLGEAKFTRAFLLFYLVNVYGGVPIPLTTDYTINTTLHRSSVEEVYGQIVTDLKGAQELLTANYLSAKNQPSTDRVRPNRYAATALLARAYLYMGEWANAEREATAVIDQHAVYKLEPDLNNAFLVHSSEAVWQLGIGPNNSSLNTWDGYYYIALRDRYFLQDDLVALMAPDMRGREWMDSFISSGNTRYNPFKYKVGQGIAGAATAEHTLVLRLAEQYLIRAEARAMLGKFSVSDGANADLNVIRDRVDLPPVSTTNITEFMPLLEKERRMELFTEWGHRWFDIKRWKGFTNPNISRADEVMPGILSGKGGTWTPESKLWPIPESEILINGNLEPNPYGS